MQNLASQPSIMSSSFVAGAHGVMSSSLAAAPHSRSHSASTSAQ